MLGFLGTPDIVVWPESTLDIALWVKSKIRYLPLFKVKYSSNIILYKLAANL